MGRLLAEGQAEAAEMVLGELAAAFPNRLYIELMRHGAPEEARSEPGLIELAYRHGLPLVATNDVHFPDREFYEAHDALLCIAQGTAVADADRKRLTRSHYFRPAAEKLPSSAAAMKVRNWSRVKPSSIYRFQRWTLSNYIGFPDEVRRVILRRPETTP